MLTRIITLLAFVAASFDATDGSAQLKKVRLAIPTVDIVTLPLKMAQAKAFIKRKAWKSKAS